MFRMLFRKGQVNFFLSLSKNLNLHFLVFSLRIFDNRKCESVCAHLTLIHSGPFQLYHCAVCLDGSPPAYHFDKGFGAGINNWLVHIEVTTVCFYFHVLLILNKI